ncbi:MAG: tRNA (adenosine(37)-N6)-threonylcarbamoyltransferase complex ATPase subunit type 1 TsaE [Clostridia bacterium]|nr:tRNA (adenosine(37)-N6)-threonylcarbamoyltransferase complex ATPase subunit type 1 TsaE [Clostridia bacterium]
MENLTNNNLENEIKKIMEHTEIKINHRYIAKGIDDTLLLAKTFAKELKKGDIIALNGELGAGKTVFVSGIAQYFGIESQICSPTFTIVNEYTLQNLEKIYHFDVYRIEDSTDFLDSIGDHYFEDGICIIEWADIIQDILPKRTITIDITKDEKNSDIRYFHIRRN